jgi:hypothetical protein
MFPVNQSRCTGTINNFHGGICYLLQVLTHWFALTNFYPERDSRGCGFISARQETPNVLGKDKTIYLRIGNVKFNAQLRRIPDQEKP